MLRMQRTTEASEVHLVDYYSQACTSLWCIMRIVSCSKSVVDFAIRFTFTTEMEVGCIWQSIRYCVLADFSGMLISVCLAL